MSANTIHLAGEYRKLQSLNLAAAQTPYPGMLLMLDSSGDLTVHATEGGDCERILAYEDALQGETVTDIYTAATLCDCGIELPGSESQVLVAVDEDIAIGDYLMSAGDGKFKEKTGTYKPLCVALEAADLTDSGDVDTLVHVRWI